MKKEYETPELELVYFEDDVITTSGLNALYRFGLNETTLMPVT